MKRRRHIPLKVKLEAALYQLGLDPEHVRLDHHPALELRRFKMVWGKKIYDPVENDPRYMQWLSTEAHAEKTTGRRGTSKLSKRGGDISEIAKTKRLEKKRPAWVVQGEKALMKPHPLLKRFGKRPWPKRKIPSRPKKET